MMSTNQSQNGAEELSNSSSQAAATKEKSYQKWTKERVWVENHELIETEE